MNCKLLLFWFPCKQWYINIQTFNLWPLTIMDNEQYILRLKEFSAGVFNLVADNRDVRVDHLIQSIQLLLDRIQFSRLYLCFLLPTIFTDLLTSQTLATAGKSLSKLRGMQNKTVKSHMLLKNGSYYFIHTKIQMQLNTFTFCSHSCLCSCCCFFLCIGLVRERAP